MAGAATTRMIPTLTLAGAEMLCNAALAEAQRLGLAPLSVAIVAASGKLLLHKAQDGTAGLVPDIALAKAQTCLALNTSSRRLREKYAKDKPTQLAAMGAIAGGQFAPFPGGVLCRDSDGLVLGAIGISGASAEEDEHCGITAANHVGFAPEPTHSSLESKST